ncbi:hypothetical protein DP939_00455 [Spongiactinospora rosea]|uniref:Uncharacterized protein n=2 Tax=Spongiactinospora rosea TaxID=2248750 RepID=A0A366M6S4_9ACTN|nr:hypothetical protein DP939_00455 [Spongiactinospora rosea]
MQVGLKLLADGLRNAHRTEDEIRLRVAVAAYEPFQAQDIRDSTMLRFATWANEIVEVDWQPAHDAKDRQSVIEVRCFKDGGDEPYEYVRTGLNWNLAWGDSSEIEENAAARARLARLIKIHNRTP